MTEKLGKVPGGLKATFAGQSCHNMGRITLSGMASQSATDSTETNSVVVIEDQHVKPAAVGTITTQNLDRLSEKVSNLTQQQKRDLRMTTLGICALYIAFSVWLLLRNPDAVPEVANSSGEVDRLAEQVRSDAKTLNHMSTFQDRMLHTIHLYGSLGPTSASSMTQSVLDTAKTPVDAEELIVFGDKLFRDGNFAMAEQYYRKAVSILGLNLGPKNRRYMDALQRLALVCHSLRRFDEEEEMLGYLKRLTQSEVN